MTLKEPANPSVNHNFQPAAESGGKDGQDQCEAKQNKDENQ